jgi:branched-chain amino acid aminotransferase
MSKEPIYYINGKFFKKSKAIISVNDLGFLRGYGVFDFFITYNNRPFLLKDHLDRLRKSAKLIGLEVPWSNLTLEKLIISTIAKNKHLKEKSVKIIVSGGSSSDGIKPNLKPTLAILVNKRHKLPKKYYENGVKVITVDIHREIPDAKTLNYTNAVYSMIKAGRMGALEAIYVDRKKDIVMEGTTSNLFLVKNNSIFTPESDILSGVTRNVVIKLAKRKNRVKVKRINFNQLFSAEEVFITASNKEILPVVQIDMRKIGDGKPGVVTKNLIKEFQNYIESGKWIN